MTAEEKHRIQSEISAALEKVRAAKKPTQRGIVICGQIMGQMLQQGWHKDQLDSLEILFWKCRDANGDPILLPAKYLSVRGRGSE